MPRSKNTSSHATHTASPGTPGAPTGDVTVTPPESPAPTASVGTPPQAPVHTSPTANGSNGVSPVSGTPATAEDVLLAESLPAPGLTRVRGFSRAIIDLCAAPGTLHLLRQYATELETIVGLDASAFEADALLAQRYADIYDRLAHSLDRVGFALRTVNKVVNHDSETLAKAGRTAAPDTDFYNASQGFVVQRQTIQGSRRAVVTRRKTIASKKAEAAKAHAAAPANPTGTVGNADVTIKPATPTG